jgi:hypothetical protein
MNDPQFVISGQKRRDLKKKLNLNKRLLRMNRFINDVDEVYGGGMTEQELISYENKLKKEITHQEKLLSKRLP